MKHLFNRHWPILWIILIWFIFASPYFLKGFIPFPSRYLVTFFAPWSTTYAMPVKNGAMPDVITQIYPWKHLTIETWKKGIIPLWNPDSFSGTPHAANYQTAIFSPFNLLFFILSEVDAWSVMVLLQPLLAGLFMYLFLRSLDSSKQASLLGGIAFMFCGFIVVWMAYATLAYAVLWLPLILLVIHREAIKSSWWNRLVLTLSIGLSFFSGHFQMSFYVSIFGMAYIVFESLRFKNWKIFLNLLLFFILGIILSMPQLLPSFDAYRESFRSSNFNMGEVIPWQYLITLVAPDFYGNPVTRNDWFGHYAEWAGYIGVLPFLFTIYALSFKKTTQVWFFGLTGFISLFLALPTPLTSLLFSAKIPVLSTSAASRIIVLTSFSFAVLSAFGVDALINNWKQKQLKKSLLVFSFIGLLALLGIWAFLFLSKPLPIDKLIIAKRNFVLPTIFCLIFFILSFLGIYIKKYNYFIIGIFIIITSYDLLRFSSKWMPFDPKEYVFPQMKVISFLQEKIGYERVFSNAGNELTGYYHFPSIEGYDALYAERYGEFIGATSEGKIGIPSRSVVLIGKRGDYVNEALKLLGVRFILHRNSDGRSPWAYPIWEYPEQYRAIYKDEHYEVFENVYAYPRVFLTSAYQIATDKEKIIDTLFEPSFNRRENLVLEEIPSFEPKTGEGKVEIKLYSPNQVIVSVKTTATKLLFLSDSYNSGWKAYINGKAVPIYRADYVFRAVSVPAGESLVVFSYEPMSIRVGLAAAAGVVGFLFIGSILKLNSKKL